MTFKCKCGGQIVINSENIGVIHTIPTCHKYDALDLDVLLKEDGLLSSYIYDMIEKVEA